MEYLDLYDMNDKKTGETMVRGGEVPEGRYLKNNTVMCNAYYMKRDIDINECKLQEEEVESVFWKTKEEIEKMIKNDEFLETGAKLFNNYII